MTMHLHVHAASSYPQAGAALLPQVLPRSRPVVPPAKPQGAVPAGNDSRLEVPLGELSFRHLRSADEIARIVHLRKGIQLVAAGAVDPGFVGCEKKETRRESFSSYASMPIRR